MRAIVCLYVQYELESTLELHIRILDHILKDDDGNRVWIGVLYLEPNINQYTIHMSMVKC